MWGDMKLGEIGFQKSKAVSALSCSLSQRLSASAQPQQYLNP